MATHDKSKSHAHGSSKVHDPEVHVAAPGHEDDLILVPKERSKLYYILMLGLMLFVLVIFTVGGLFTSVVGGGAAPTDEVVMTWQEPGGDKHEVHASELVGTMQVANNLAYLGFYQPIHQEGRGNVRIEEEDAALFLILERMADQSGVEISDAEFKKRMRGMGWNNAQLLAAAERYRMTPMELSKEIRRGMRVGKFRTLVQTMVLVAPDPELVAQRWQAANPEYQFQVVEANADSMLAQATSEVPSDDALLEWFHARPVGEQMQLFTEERLRPEVAWVDLDAGFDSNVLLTRYPVPADWDEAAKGDEYYRLNKTLRFKKPVEEGSEPPANRDDLYFPLEEIRDKVTAEARIFQALAQFATDLRERAETSLKDPAVSAPDFRAEAEALGLRFDAPTELHTRVEIREYAGWGGIPVENQLGMLPEGAFGARPNVTEHSLSVVRLIAKQKREEPPFGDIRDGVAEKWAKARASELAQAKLQTIFEGFVQKDAAEDPANPIAEPAVADDAAFLAAVEQAGLSVIERPFLARGKSPSDDPDAESNLNRYLRFQGAIYALDKGALLAPAKSFFEDTYYLIRLKDQRDADLSELKAKDLFTTRSEVSQENMAKFNDEAFNPENEAFKARFGVWMKHWADAEKQDAAGTTKS